MSKVSIIIRGKNEEDWLAPTLKGVNSQNYKDFEIIYIDNKSEDSSIKIAEELKVNKIIKIKDYLPGLAINKGIEVSTGKYICILSAHCVPSDKNWLSNLVKSLEEDEKIAGVYGRQLPLASSSSDDARDLLMTFGLEDRYQRKDPFFHNANSIVRKDVIKKFPFNEKIKNIEDREWAERVIKSGFILKYSSESKVFHFHGLHQHGKKKSFRADNVRDMISKISLNDDTKIPSWLKLSERKCPIVFYGKNVSYKKKIKDYLKINKGIRERMFLYSDDNNHLKDISHLKRTVSIKASFSSFVKDIMKSLNKEMGYSPEGICFVDLSYENFIKDAYKINKEKVFHYNYPFSAFAFEDKGDILFKYEDEIKPLKNMFDTNATFYRISFGQSTIMRTSKIKKFIGYEDGGYVVPFYDLRNLLRKK
tara:strand:+ start:1636 stop:2898 length:1263 start_codon:yes stop_codon:yes gene_type:complete